MPQTTTALQLTDPAKGWGSARTLQQSSSAGPTPLNKAVDCLCPPGHRTPAMLSGAAMVLATLAVVLTMISQAHVGVTEWSCAVEGVGVDYGGVGGGVWGFDAGLLQVTDVAQFVVQSGQLAASANATCSLQAFTTYFVPFTGLLPLVSSSASRKRFFPVPLNSPKQALKAPVSTIVVFPPLTQSPDGSFRSTAGRGVLDDDVEDAMMNATGTTSNDSSPEPSSSPVPQVIAALLQGPYWSSRLRAEPWRLLRYAYLLGLLWALGTVVAATALAKVARLPSASQVRGSRWRPSSAAALWVAGRLTGLFVFLYHLLAVASVCTSTVLLGRFVDWECCVEVAKLELEVSVHHAPLHRSLDCYFTPHKAWTLHRARFLASWDWCFR